MTAPASVPVAGALAGCRVLDFSAMVVGPYCTRWMADLGAEVIKVEPIEGERMREGLPVREGYSAYFGHLNCGKKSIAVDLKRPAAVHLLKRLASDSDVVVENFRPGVMRRLGLGYEALSRINPRLVYCSISGYGQTGPGADRPAYAPIVHAASGLDLAHFEYQDGLDRPANTGIFTADVLTAVFAAFSIQAALLQRERTGLGQLLDVSLMESTISLMMYELQAAQFPSPGRRHVYKPLRASDGFVIITPISENNFASMCHAIGHPEWKSEDPRFADLSARRTNWDEMMRLTEQWTSQRTARECEAVLMAAGVPCARYASVAEVLRDPQLKHRGSFARVEDGGGAFLVPNLPFRMSGSRAEAGSRVPALGEHTGAVLRELLGMSAADIEALRDQRAIFDRLPAHAA